MAWKAHADYVMKREVQRWRQDLGRLPLARTSWPDKYSRRQGRVVQRWVKITQG